MQLPDSGNDQIEDLQAKDCVPEGLLFSNEKIHFVECTPKYKVKRETRKAKTGGRGMSTYSYEATVQQYESRRDGKKVAKILWIVFAALIFMGFFSCIASSSIETGFAIFPLWMIACVGFAVSEASLKHADVELFQAREKYFNHLYEIRRGMSLQDVLDTMDGYPPVSQRNNTIVYRVNGLSYAKGNTEKVTTRDGIVKFENGRVCDVSMSGSSTTTTTYYR